MAKTTLPPIPRRGIDHFGSEIGNASGVETATDVLAGVVGFIPGYTADAAFAPLAMVKAGVKGRRELGAIQEFTGENNLNVVAVDSKGMQKKLRSLDDGVVETGKEYGSLAAGSAAGWAAGSAVGATAAGSIASMTALGSFAGPVGTIAGFAIGTAGALGGGAAAHYVYDHAFKTQDQDAVRIAIKAHEAQSKGEEVPPEVVFATLAANLPEVTGKQIEDRLQQLTGTRMFHEAVAQGKTAELQQLMREFDDVIRADTMMPLDMKDLGKTASEQYAEMINTGTLDARALLLHPDRLPALSNYYKQMAEAQGLQPIAGIGEVNAIAGNLRNNGVAPAGDDAAQDLPPVAGGRNDRKL